uniref:Uncharacterized protein n=1 Tax=Rhizophora mucronata TaxID=61149 RepID=A0A2P2MGL5_RHIMU
MQKEIFEGGLTSNSIAHTEQYVIRRSRTKSRTRFKTSSSLINQSHLAPPPTPKCIL